MDANSVLYGMYIACTLGCAYRHFRPPPEHRWTTTILKYWLACSGYALIILCIFILFSESSAIALPLIPLIPWLPNNNGILELDRQGPLAGLILTIFFLFVPRVQKPQEWIRKKFWEIAAIPKQAEILSDALMKAQYNVPDTLQYDTRYKINTQSLDYEHLLENGGKLGKDWIKLVSIFIKLKQLISDEERRDRENNAESSAFTRYRNRTWSSIEEKYATQEAFAPTILKESQNGNEMVTPTIG